MKRFLTLLFLMCSLLAFSQQDVLFDPGKDHFPDGGALSSGVVQLLPAGQVTDIVFSRLQLEVDPAVKYIKGIVTHYVMADRPDDTVYLLLSDSLLVDSVTVNGLQGGYSRPGSDRLIVALANATGQTIDSVSIAYHGVPPSTGFGSFVTDNHNGVPILWTLSQPYGASDWWPCQNALTDKTDSIEMIVTCPAGNRVASNGILQRVDYGVDASTWHWKHRFPIADYLVAFAVTNYAVYEERVPVGNDTLLIVNYVYPEDSADRCQRTKMIWDVYQLFTDLYGPYPFLREKYGHAEFGRGGGMEHQTMTFISGFDYEVMVHELAHQWFGDAITCGSWYDLWLNEGWATYSSALAYQYLLNGVFWNPWKSLWRGRVTALPDGAVQTPDTLDVGRLFDQRLTYGKAAYVIHMLRWVLTDSVFFPAVRSYLSDSRLMMGFARTDDFRSHLEVASGLDLEHFFEVWLRGEGFPSYTLGWSHLDDTLTVVVHQETSHSSVPFFKLPLPVHVFVNGFDTALRLDNTTQDQYFKIKMTDCPDSLQFDPEQWILSANNQISGIYDVEDQSVMKIFPNPARQKVNFLLPQTGVVSICDLTGKVVFSGKFLGNNVQSIDLMRLNQGTYLVTFVGERIRQHCRLVVL